LWYVVVAQATAWKTCAEREVKIRKHIHAQSSQKRETPWIYKELQGADGAEKGIRKGGEAERNSDCYEVNRVHISTIP